MKRSFEKIWGGKGSDTSQDVISKQTPRISFELVKINRRGTRQKRELTFSDDGISNMKGKSRQWFFMVNDIFGIEPAGKTGKDAKPILTVKVIKRYQFECESDEQLERIIKVFYQLYSDRLPINNSQHYNGHGAFIGDFISKQQFDISSPNNNNLSNNNNTIVSNNNNTVSPVNNNLQQQQVFDNNNPSTSTMITNNQDSPSLQQQQQLAAYMGKKIGIHSFELLKVIGEGSFSKVCLVRKKDTRQIYALKVLDKSEIKRRNQVEHTITEKHVLSTHRHPFIIKMYHSFQAEDKLYMCLQFIPGGELFGHLRKVHKFTLELSKFYLCEVILAIEYLHNNNIIYRDLKPENILLNADGHIKLTDFGLAKEGITSVGGNSSGVKTKTFCGTPDYLSPEIIKGLPHGKGVDYWSIGVLMFEFLTGRSPFRGSNRKELYEQILHTHPVYPKEITEATNKTILVDDDPIKGIKLQEPIQKNVLVDLLDRLLLKKPEERLGSAGIQEIKSHPFFDDVDWDLMLQKQITPPFKPPLSDNPNENLQKIIGNNLGIPLENLNGNIMLLNDKEQSLIMPKTPFQASQSPSFCGFTYNEMEDKNFLNNNKLGNHSGAHSTISSGNDLNDLGDDDHIGEEDGGDLF
ncbi:hypothetical protein ABK040_015624 [Willaertia magna]